MRKQARTSDLRRRLVGVGGGLLGAVLCTVPADAAERIFFNYGLLGLSLPVSDLETYTRTGVMSERMAFLASLAGAKDVVGLRDALNTPLPFSQAQVAQLTYTPLGERTLQRIGNLLRTDTDNNSFLALRAASILAAGDPQGLTLLNFLRYYPLQTLRIDVAFGAQLAAEVGNAFDLGETTFSAIEKQADGTPSTAPPPAELGDPRRAGPFGTRVRPLVFANPRYAAAETWLKRASTPMIAADVYLPEGLTRPAPVVVISHGLASDRTTFAYLARHLASWGFAAAVLDHPGSDKQLAASIFSGSATSSGPGEFIARPQYVSSLLDELERLTRTDPLWRGRLDPTQAGIAGQSLGGYTALASGGAGLDKETIRLGCEKSGRLGDIVNPSLLLECGALNLPASAPTQLGDARIKAIFAVNPIGVALFGRKELARIAVPTLLVSANKDAFARPLLEQILPFSVLTTSEKYLVLARNATHFTPAIDPAETQSVLPIPAQFVGPSPEPYFFAALNALNLAFFKTHLAGETAYRAFLQPGYVRSLSQEPFGFSLVNSLDSPEIQRLIELERQKQFRVIQTGN
ncbi:alpha/beta hydrolase [Gloeobacter morelensis]|uniref:Alpha/beta hydrolase n=1 Tax=Gloeobacter morelensis MG652769 TaxID=2781736 RepID=A0ABY3PQW0_9CYAN|nr:alpha/beta hydrolase [Gloeobacter morelensis]UFP96101.1 alpha/beta hydrolase [Gloeobacter morelensis MG652769]